MYIVTGNTFPYSDILKRLGAYWNRAEKRWQIEALNRENREAIEQTPGLLLQKLDDVDIWQVQAPIRLEDDKPVYVGDDMTYLNHFADQDPIMYAGFSSLESFIDHVAALERPDNSNRTCDVGWTVTPEYAGTRDMAEAIRIARDGWVDGLGLDKYMTPPAPRSKQRVRSVTGGAVNVGRMLAGAPDHMTKRKTMTGRRIITLFVAGSMYENVSINQAIIRVAAIAAMVDRLENEGYSCAIYSVICDQRRVDHLPVQIVIKLKEAGERLSIANISYAFGHPSFWRRMCYALIGCIPECNVTHNLRIHRGITFTSICQPRSNEYFIRAITAGMNTMKRIIETITPENLPVKLEGF